MAHVTVGFIGAGRHARANIYPAAHLAGARIAAVCARHLDRAETTARQFQAERAYDDYHEMLRREDLDAAFVITEGEQHAKIVADCLRAGVPVFVEKPLGLTVEEAAEVADISSRVRKIVMVGFMKRFAPSYIEMKRLMYDEPTFGKVHSLYGMFAIGTREGWTDEPYIKLGGIHYVDLLRHLCGEIQAVKGFTNSHGALVNQFFTFRFETGPIGGMFFAGLPSWVRHYEEITATGTKGFVKVENLMRVIYHLDRSIHAPGPRWQTLDEEDHLLTPVSTSGSGGLRDLYLNGYAGEVQHFVDCVREGREPMTSAADNVKTLRLCERIVEALSQ